MVVVVLVVVVWFLASACVRLSAGAHMVSIRAAYEVLRAAAALSGCPRRVCIAVGGQGVVPCEASRDGHTLQKPFQCWLPASTCIQ